MNVKVVLPGHGKEDAITLNNGSPAVDDSGMLIVTKEDDDSVELARFERYLAYWTE